MLSSPPAVSRPGNAGAVRNYATPRVRRSPRSPTHVIPSVAEESRPLKLEPPSE